MDREEVLRLGLLTEEQLNNCETMTKEEWDAMMSEAEAFRPQIDQIFQEIIEMYEDICE